MAFRLKDKCVKALVGFGIESISCCPTAVLIPQLFKLSCFKVGKANNGRIISPPRSPSPAEASITILEAQAQKQQDLLLELTLTPPSQAIPASSSYATTTTNNDILPMYTILDFVHNNSIEMKKGDDIVDYQEEVEGFSLEPKNIFEEDPEDIITNNNDNMMFREGDLVDFEGRNFFFVDLGLKRTTTSTTHAVASLPFPPTLGGIMSS